MERITRREALGRGAALAGIAATGGALSACGSTSTPRSPRVVIVGAGLAGLTCAYRLRQTGVSATLFEAQQRVGGRCWSTRVVVPGLVGEHGGELIDARHLRIRALAAELALPLEDRTAAAGRAADDAILIGGRSRDAAQLRAARAEVIQRLQREAATAGTLRAGRAGAAARALDERSARDWLDAAVPGGADSLLGRALAAEMTVSFGRAPQDLSAVALLQAYGGGAPEPRFHVRGGNDQIPRKLAAGLPEKSLRVGSGMQGLRRRAGGDYQLILDRYRRPVRADVVVLTQPLPSLRQADLTRSGIPTGQLRMIDELGMGTSAKLLVGLRRRPRAFGGWSGDLVADAPALTSFEASLGQRPALQAGLLSVLAAGALPAGTAAHASAPDALVRSTLARLERVAPGIRDALTGAPWLDRWDLDRWAGGTRAVFGPGQATRFWGLLQQPADRIVFAGEHTATNAQGTLEGAVESGERAARQVRALLGARL